MDDDILFCFDNKGEDKDTDEEKMNASMSSAFVSAAHTMKSTENEGRKRKEGLNAEKKKIKFVKYDLGQNSDSARTRSAVVSNDGVSSESEVDNPISDNDSDTKE